MTALLEEQRRIDPLEAWKVPEGEYPVQARPMDKLRFLLRYAVLAPSSHNTQPWLFRLRSDTVELYADRSRALAVVDPADRELTMSCGAALLHLRAAIWNFGYEGEVQLFPDAGEEDLLSRIRLGKPHRCTTEEADLFNAILRRHTNRRPFEEREVPQSVLFRLRVEARVEGAWLHIVEGEALRSRVAELVAEGDRLQWSHASFRRELAAWLHPNTSSIRDGIRGYGLGFGDLMSKGMPSIIRTFDLGNQTAATDRAIATGSPALAVLLTEADSPSDWLAAGQALARILLTARSEEVWASFLNQPIEVPELRTSFRGLLGTSGFPQILLRMGYGPDIKPTPRRLVEEVLLPEYGPF